MPEPIAFENIDIKGELAVRSGLSYSRLEGKWYRPDEIFTADKHGWPGDWEGRVILALVMHARATRRTPAYLDEIIDLVPKYFNERGYLGTAHPEGVCDEQQLSGHSWLVRGLTEHYTWTKDPRSLRLIEGLTENLFLKTRGRYRIYPIDTDPAKRALVKEWVLSKLQTKTKHHAETSDCGCAFIPLDGVTAVYETLRKPELKDLIEEMIGRFSEIDFVGLKVQTHATLSGLRGILRYYELEGRRQDLDLAVRIFDLYKTEAWTETYANYNWFGHPRWTEPCAIVDSFMVATTLWKHTGNPLYLEDAQHIYYNALCHHQRSNGGFGSNNCTGALEGNDIVYSKPNNYETFWCCTMRGAEGISRAIQYTVFTDGEDVVFPFYHPCTVRLPYPDGHLTLEVRTKYPYDGKVELEVRENTLRRKVGLRFFAPSWTGRDKIAPTLNDKPLPATFDNGFLRVASLLRPGDRIALDLGLYVHIKDAGFKNSVKGYHTFRFGPAILAYKRTAKLVKEEYDDFAKKIVRTFEYPPEFHLGKDTVLEPLNDGHATFKVKGQDITLSPLCDVRDLPVEETADQVLFRA